MHTPLRRRLRLARRWAAYLLAVVLVLMALALGAASQVLPLAERHPGRIAAWLSEKAGRPVAFEGVRTQWTRRGPLLRLEGLHIGDADGGVHIGQAEVLVSMYAGLLPGRSFTELRLHGPSLTLERADDGRWSVRGLPMTGTADPLDYLEGMGELQVIGGALEVRAPQLGLRTRIPKIDLRLRVDGPHVGGGARAYIRPDAAPAALAFEFDRGSGDGRAYFDLDTGALGAWAPLLHHGGIAPADGRGRVEAWGELRAHRVVMVTTRAQLRHLLLSGAPLADGRLPQVRMDELRGRARWRVGAEGWRLDAPQLRIADQRGEQVLDGLVVAGGQRIALLADEVDATPLLAMAALSDRLSPGLREWMLHAAPQAKLAGVELAGVRGGPLHVQGRLERVAFAAVGDAPGLDGLSGRFEGDGQGWQLALDPRSALRFDWPRGFGVVHDLQLDGTLLAWREGEGWEVGTPALRVDGGDYGVDVRGGLWFQGDGTRPWIGIAAAIDDTPVTVARKFWVHHKMPKAAIDWLDMALQDGVVSGGRGLVAGDLDDWPFVHGNGRFEATAQIRDGRVRFQPDWPELEAMQAEVAFVGNGFQVQGQGQVAGLPVQRVQAGIAEFGRAPLLVRAEARGDAARMLELLRASPLQQEHRDTFDNLAASGPAATRFALDLPPGGGGRARINGTVVLDGAKLAEKRWNLEFDAVRGDARYDNNGFDAPRLAARHRGQDATLALRAGGHVRDAANAFEASLDAPLDAADLFARAPELDWLAPRVRGRSPWTLAVALPKRAVGDSVGTLRLQSSLVGTALALPPPLAKPAGDALPTTVQVGLPLGSGAIDVAFGERLALRARQKDGRTGVRVKLGSATVDAEPPASGLVVGGRTASLDALEWIGLAKGGGEGGLPLREIDVLADELQLLGGVFPGTRLKLRPAAQSLEVDVAGPALAGSVSVPDQAGALVRGRFARLHWQPPRAKAGTAAAGDDGARAGADTQATATPAPTPASADAGFDPAAIPPLAMDIDDLRYRDAPLGRALLRTRPVPGGLRLEQLQVQDGKQRIDATGEWLGRGDTARTHLALQVDSGDMGALMDGLGYRNWLARGEGQVRFDASWPGSPAGFSLAGLQGSLRIDASDGQLLEVEPGAGRVLGLFSLAQLPRRLMLDFRDFFSRGFAFDRLEGSVRFGDGQAHTDDMRIDGPAADIRIRGDTDLRAQRFDQTIDVLPKSGNLLTVVGAVAGGPVGAAMGAAANAVLSRPLGELGAKTYRVSGPWKEPKVEVITREQPRGGTAGNASAEAGAAPR